MDIFLQNEVFIWLERRENAEQRAKQNKTKQKNTHKKKKNKTKQQPQFLD